MERILHLLWTSDLGGIEKLCLMLGENDTENNLFCVVNEKGRLYEQMEREGLQVQFLGMGTKDTAKIYRVIRQMYRDGRFSVLIVQHDSSPLWLAAIRLKQRCSDCRVYLYAHCDYKYSIADRLSRKLIFAAAVRRTDGVIAISDYVKSSITSTTKLPEEKIRVLYDGVDIGRFSSVCRSPFDGTMRLVYVGRLIPEKGLRVLMDALRNLDGNIPFQCTIVGYGKDLTFLQQQAEENGITQRVNFVGAQKDVRPYLSEADVFVHPAVCEEGFGITLVEAMAGGLPCVAFRKGAIPEIITDGKDGFLVSDVCAEALTDKLRKIYTILGTNEYARICANARESAKNFSKEQYIFNLQTLANNEK